MLGIKRIDHIAIAAESLQERVAFYKALFGMQDGHRFDVPEAGYNGVALKIPGSDTEWEILEPAGEDSFVRRFLDERGPGLHHVTFQVESVERAAAALRSQGIEPFGLRLAGRTKELFIHPRDAGGVLIQLYEGSWT